MAKYKLRNNPLYKADGTTVDSVIQDILDTEFTPNTAIPKDPANTAYQEYLAWVDAGNTPDPANSNLETWESIRDKRDQLLKESDWTMTTGATIDQAQWAAYREKLRDLPQKYSSHSDVVWPTPPSTKGPNTK